jgi:hypothetical protein
MAASDLASRCHDPRNSGWSPLHPAATHDVMRGGFGADGWEELIRHLPRCSHETGTVVCLPALWSTFPGHEDLRCLLYLSLHCEGQHSGQTMSPAGYAILDLGQGHRTSAERLSPHARRTRLPFAPWTRLRRSHTESRKPYLDCGRDAADGGVGGGLWPTNRPGTMLDRNVVGLGSSPCGS